MLTFDTKGQIYSCLKYMECSLKTEQNPLIIGNCKNGICNNKITQQNYINLININRKTISTDQCFNCTIASGCQYCPA
jgi:radical SAM protein with 4Fe4S-binding SPASM domain